MIEFYKICSLFTRLAKFPPFQFGFYSFFDFSLFQALHILFLQLIVTHFCVAILLFLFNYYYYLFFYSILFFFSEDEDSQLSSFREEHVPDNKGENADEKLRKEETTLFAQIDPEMIHGMMMNLDRER